MRRVAKKLIFPLLLLFVLVGAQPAVAAPYPRSMAALGDSMTRAANVCCWYGDHPAQSWSTGYAGFDGINSHYERLLSLRQSIAGRNYNDAKSGARMADLPRQAQLAVQQGAEYVTIEMGANDVCTSSSTNMTSTGSFEADYRSALNILQQGLPRARVFVASIPNIYLLWELMHTNPVAPYVWDVANICQSMLYQGNSDTDRARVLAHEQVLNGILAGVCSEFSNCKGDGGAVFDYQFSASDVSVLDYFHPSIRGQANLANVTWSHSYWAG